MKLQKRLASKILKCSPNRVKFTAEDSSITEAITRFDVKKLIGRGLVTRKPKSGNSRARANKQKAQKKKGRRRGVGSRKGTQKARTNTKEAWMVRARTQRALIKRMLVAGHITKETYKALYGKIKGGFFRSIRHVKFYCEEQHLIQKK